jgi:flagellar assembly factor FliW
MTNHTHDHDDQGAAVQTTLVRSSRFGDMEIPAEAVISFPAGLIGLGGQRYALLAREEDSAFAWLHSLDDPDLAIPVTNPWRFFADFSLELSDDDAERVGVDGDGQAAVWVTVRAGERPEDCMANLAAPILVHEGRGFQVINHAPDAPMRAPLFGERRAEAA